MPKANEVKKGTVVRHDDAIYTVREVSRSAPTARGGNTLYRIRLERVPDGQKLELSLKGDEVLADADLLRRMSQFSYHDGERFVFMDNEDFNQYLVDPAVVGDAAGFITDGLDEIYVMLVDDQVVGIQLPQSVVLEVTETAPQIKGATATKSNKPATLETGVEVLVPDYVTNGEKIRVNTETREFMSRA
jgi:elongation factor P